MAHRDQTGVLFVCLGNICRSPLAEGVFLHLAAERGLADRFDVDSCGTGRWHIGKRADPRSIAVARKYGVDLPSRARQVDPVRDFPRFRWILPMDPANEAELLALGAPRDRVRLFRGFDPAMAHRFDHDGLAIPGNDDEIAVPDPYYGGDDGFDTVYTMVKAACKGLLDRLGRTQQ